ncbi:MAG: D-glucuronyl C5-epimerase family protein, partial [bacterium]
FGYPKDERGIPQVYMGKNTGLRYNPVTVAQYGLFKLQVYDRSRAPEDLDTVKTIVTWLLEKCTEWRSGITAWIYDYDLDFYGHRAPWISAMAQAQGISLLLRVYSLLPNDSILYITQSAFEAFLHPVREGGVTASFPDGALVFEEYPTDPPSLVLNGHIFALLGIFDYATFWQDKAAFDLFGVAITGLKKNLERYDTGYWNLYDLHPTRRLASPMYIEVHFRLLTLLSEITGDDFFRKAALRWRRYLRSPACRLRWLLNKVNEKVGMKR